jgi:hypothetical protein
VLILAAMSEPLSPFEMSSTFEAGEVQAAVRLGRLEAQYEELFSEVIEDGIITVEERAQLERAAEALGLDRARLLQVEQALTRAYESRRRVRVHEVAAPAPVVQALPDDDAPRASLAPLTPLDGGAELRAQALARRVQVLEARIAELEREVEELRADAAVDVDLSGVSAAPATAAQSDDPDDLVRQLRHDPRDLGLLHALFRALGAKALTDRRWCVAHVLGYLGAATPEERALLDAHRTDGLVRPRASLSRDGWQRLLIHPDQEAVVGELFAAVLGPVLLGRIAAMRRDGTLPKLDPATRQAPATSTLTAIRCFAWAGAILGVQIPPLHTDPSSATTVAMVPATQPSLRLGKLALSGRSPTELAFLAGEHLSYFRDDAFMRALFHSIVELEDLFLAALAIGNPALPMTASVRARVTPIAQAIEPMLEPVQIDRLRGGFLRFVEDGGRANLQRWANAVDATAARAGLLLSNDLAAAEAVLKLEDPSGATERMDDLLVFALGDRYANLRKQLGVAVE